MLSIIIYISLGSMDLTIENGFLRKFILFSLTYHGINIY